MSTEPDFYQTSLNVLTQLLEINLIDEIQYWNAVKALPLLRNHPDRLSTPSELAFLFTFGSIKDIRDISFLKKLLVLFGIDNTGLYITAHYAMNLPPPDPDFDPTNLLIRYLSMEPRFVNLERINFADRYN